MTGAVSPRRLEPEEAPAPREHGILFSAPMVRALAWQPLPLKTETRRLPNFGNCRLGDWHMTKAVWAQLDLERAEVYGRRNDGTPSVGTGFVCPWKDGGTARRPVIYPRVRVGDRIYVRETWATRRDEDDVKPRDLVQGRHTVWFWANPQTARTGCAGAAGKTRPAIFLPRWAARIWLTVTEVEVQRLHDITQADARAEGIPDRFADAVSLGICSPMASGAIYHASGARDVYANLWHAIHGPGSWTRNPVVFVYRFNVEVRR